MKFASILLLSSVVWSSAAFSAPSIRLYTLFGAQSLEVKRGNSTTTIKEGDTLVPHDEFKTGPEVSARLVFPDQSQVWVGRSSSVQINSAGEVMQLVYLNSGQIRIQVPKSPVAQSQRKIKFIVRTPATTMGVRGTDFVVDSSQNGKSYQLHTLEGDVLAAHSNQEIIKENGVTVSTGNFISGEANHPIPQPAAFDVGKYELALNKQQPEFSKFSQAPLPVITPEVRIPNSTTAAPISDPTGVRQRMQRSMEQDENRANQGTEQ